MTKGRNLHEILASYQARVRQFDKIAARRGNVPDEAALPALYQQPTAPMRRLSGSNAD